MYLNYYKEGVIMDQSDISPELREKAKACKTPNELVELAEETGVELTDEQLDQITGGSGWNSGCMLSRDSAG